MSRNKLSKWIGMAAIAAVLFAGAQASAQTHNWQPVSPVMDANWSDPNVWDGVIADPNTGPTGPGVVVNFAQTLDPNYTPMAVSLDGLGITVGTVNFTGSGDYSIIPGTGGTLTFDSNSGLPYSDPNGAALIYGSVSGAVNRITAPITLDSLLTINTAYGNALFIEGGISAADANIRVTQVGDGRLALTADSTFEGGFTFATDTRDSMLALAAPNAVGAGPLTFAFQQTGGSVLYLVADDEAQGDHSSTELILSGAAQPSMLFGMSGGQGFNADGTVFDDSNIVLEHKLGGVTFTEDAQYLRWLGNDHLRVTGTTTLDGNSCISAYRTRAYLDGTITGSGTLVIHSRSLSGGLNSVVVTNNTNNYTGGARVLNNEKLIITAPNALPGTVELDNSSLYSIGVTDEQADHSATNIVLIGGSSHYLNGGEVLLDTDDAPRSDGNLAVQHKFGDLTFTMNGQSVYWYGTQDGDFGHITGTTTLVGDNTVSGYRGRLFLEGVVTGSGKLIINGAPSGGVNSVVLSNNNNNYTGGTAAYSENVIITAPNAIPDSIELYGMYLYSVAVTEAQADHSSTDIVLRASSFVGGGQSLGLTNDAPLDDANIKITHKFGGITWGTNNVRLTVAGNDDPGLDAFEFTGVINVNETNCELRAYRGTTILSGPITGSGRLTIVGSDGSDGVYITSDNNNRAGDTYIYHNTVLGAPNALTGDVYVAGRYVYSIGMTDAEATHLATNIVLTGTGITDFSGYQGWNADYDLVQDANAPIVIHTFGNLTFTQDAQDFRWRGDQYTDHVRIAGTITLADDANCIVTGYRSRVYLDGQITGSGTLVISGYLSGSVNSVVLGNNNNHTGGTLVLNNEKLIIAAPNAITGTLELNNSSLYSVGVTDAQADHSATDILLTGGATHYIRAGEVLEPTTDIPASDANLTVQHKFGDLTFTMNGQSLRFESNPDGDYLHFAGTTTLVAGDNSVSGYRTRLFLDGVITGSGTLIIYGGPSGSVNSVVLTNNNNNYTGGTRVLNEMLIITGPNVIPGWVELNGQRLYAVALTDAQADHSHNDVILMSSSRVTGGQLLLTGNDIPDDDPNAGMIVTHKFGALTFGAGSLTLTTGQAFTGNDVIEFTGTTTLADNQSTIYTREDAVLSGQVVGNGMLIKTGHANNAGGRLTLAASNNTYSGGTQVNLGAVYATAGRALGTGDVELVNGGNDLYLDAADALGDCNAVVGYTVNEDGNAPGDPNWYSVSSSVLHARVLNAANSTNADITNNGLFNVAANASATVGAVLPGPADSDANIEPLILRNTTIDANSALSVAKIVQDTVTIGANATLTIRGSSKTTSVINSLSIDAANGGMLDLDSSDDDLGNMLVLPGATYATVAG
ncbi:MAG TPA: hypothetical protein VM487_24125, partial [Phycisphaerae bacterium]|nr:hypothetical protein [Phycisphaerae bacterium]